MKLQRKKRISWILMIVWMLVIFIMSNQPGEISSKQSNLVLYIFNLVGINLSKSLGEFATLVVRKVAHFSEYMILLFFVYNVLKFYMDKTKAKVIGLLIVFLYACTDEFHQLFVEGRAGQFKDVLIDTSGGLGGVLITYVFEKINSNRNKAK